MNNPIHCKAEQTNISSDGLIRSNLCLDPFSIDQSSARQSANPDSVSAPITSNNALIDKALESYNRIPRFLERFKYGLTYMSVECSNKRKLILTPVEITILSNRIDNETDRWSIYTKGLYLTSMIYDSYSSGNNGFVLDNSDNSLGCQAYHLQGRWDRPLKLTITSGVNTQSLISTSDCDITVGGDLDEMCIDGSVNSCFDLYGTIKIPGLIRMAKGCTFTVHDEAQYDILYEKLPKENNLVLKGDDGNIILKEYLK